MLPNVNITWVPVEVRCGSGFMWSEKFEKKEEVQWAQESDQSDLTP
jgi:hypothetical protein